MRKEWGGQRGVCWVVVNGWFENKFYWLKLPTHTVFETMWFYGLITPISILTNRAAIGCHQTHWKSTNPLKIATWSFVTPFFRTKRSRQFCSLFLGLLAIGMPLPGPSNKVSQNKNKKSEISPELGFVSIKIDRLSKCNFSSFLFLSFLIDWLFGSPFYFIRISHGR